MSSNTVVSAREWRASLFALAALGGSLALQSPALAIAALIPVFFFGYRRLARATERTIQVERSVTPTAPTPGEQVTVTLDISTADGDPIADFRLIDAVPEALAVVEGSPRMHTAITGDGTTLSYDVIAKRGDFEFGTPSAEVRPASGAFIQTPKVEVTGVETLSCRVLLEELPLQDQTIHFVGQAETDLGGSGVEFYSTREYRHGDPMSRIDWRRYARGGGLTTVEYREEQTIPIVFLVDVRPSTQVARGPGHPTALDLCLYGAEQGTLALTEDGTPTGLSLFGSDGWVTPSATKTVHEEISTMIDSAEAEMTDGGKSLDDTTDAETFDVETAVERLKQRLPTGAQVVFWTPVLDTVPITAVRRLVADQIPVTVVSPDVTSGETPGKRIQTVDRQIRLKTLRGLGAEVIDWDTDEPVALALERAVDRGRRP